VDRKKELIIRGGANIYPREIEEVLFQHPKVLEAAAVGVPDPRIGERVCACVVLRPGGSLTLDELVLFLRDKIATYKLPEFLHWPAHCRALRQARYRKGRCAISC
jgi:acyl-CoA synthetase (AMP-forming)/AMP-acid ligase II